MKYLTIVLAIGYVYCSDITKVPRIIGGADAEEGQFPYHASLTYLHNHSFICSASIISDQWVLTAAKCIKTNVANMCVVVGRVHLVDYGFGYNVDSAVAHPEYAPDWPSSVMHDIALIRVVGSIRLQDDVRPIALSSNIRFPLSRKFVLTGWGAIAYTSEGFIYGNDLQFGSVESTNIEQCEYALGSNLSDVLVQCAKSEYEFNGPCKGDEGGPLVYEGEQVGIAFGGWSCTSSRRPNMFTKVGGYRGWIRKVSGV